MTDHPLTAQIEGSVGVVTGAASGMGRELARQLGARGARLVVADKNADGLAETVAQLSAVGVEVIGQPCDVSSDAEVDALAAAAANRFGSVELLVNVASLAVFGPPVGVAIEQWKDVLDINFAGVVRCVNAFVPAMIERGYGWVITFSSLAGIMTYPGAEGSGLYVTSKFAVHGYSESLNLYLRPRGIGVTCAFPGRVATGFGTRGRLVGTSDTSWDRVPDWAPIDTGVAVARVVEAMTEGRFVAFTEDKHASWISDRYADLEVAITADVGA